MINTVNTNSRSSSCADLEPFALMVTGNDMEPEFGHGTIITIDPGHPLINGAYIVAEVGNELYFRQYQVIAGRPYLKALNSEKTIELTEWHLKGVTVQSYKDRIVGHYQYPEANKVIKHKSNRKKSRS